jgi:hypothetical protein
MQNNRDVWNQKYQSLLDAKMARLKALSPDTLTDLRQ